MSDHPISSRSAEGDFPGELQFIIEDDDAYAEFLDLFAETRREHGPHSTEALHLGTMSVIVAWRREGLDAARTLASTLAEDLAHPEADPVAAIELLVVQAGIESHEDPERSLAISREAAALAQVRLGIGDHLTLECLALLADALVSTDRFDEADEVVATVRTHAREIEGDPEWQELIGGGLSRTERRSANGRRLTAAAAHSVAPAHDASDIQPPQGPALAKVPSASRMRSSLHRLRERTVHQLRQLADALDATSPGDDHQARRDDLEVGAADGPAGANSQTMRTADRVPSAQSGPGTGAESETSAFPPVNEAAMRATVRGTDLIAEDLAPMERLEERAPHLMALFREPLDLSLSIHPNVPRRASMRKRAERLGYTALPTLLIAAMVLWSLRLEAVWQAVLINAASVVASVFWLERWLERRRQGRADRTILYAIGPDLAEWMSRWSSMILTAAWSDPAAHYYHGGPYLSIGRPGSWVGGTLGWRLQEILEVWRHGSLPLQTALTPSGQLHCRRLGTTWHQANCVDGDLRDRRFDRLPESGRADRGAAFHESRCTGRRYFVLNSRPYPYEHALAGDPLTDLNAHSEALRTLVARTIDVDPDLPVTHLLIAFQNHEATFRSSVERSELAGIGVDPGEFLPMLVAAADLVDHFGYDQDRDPFEDMMRWNLYDEVVFERGWDALRKEP